MRFRSPSEIAPLLCAGLIGYRALRFAGDAERLGLYGFGAAAHLLAQIAVQQGRQAFAFTRPGDTAGQQFARTLGCAWAGGSDEAPPELLEAALIFAPAGELVVRALESTVKGGTVIVAGIHLSDIPAFPYRLLWGERTIRSVANLTRSDAKALFQELKAHPVTPAVTVFKLSEANSAIAALRAGRVKGAAVLVP